MAEAYRIIRGELDAYGEGLADKVELLALNKIDALSPEERAEKIEALKAASGKTPFLVSGVSGEGVTELLRAAWAEVRQTRGEIAVVGDDDAIPETPGGWQP
ncbi:GTPase Obg/CgtA [compost metagenome]